MITRRGQCIGEKKKKSVTFSKRPTMWEAPHFDKEAETEALTEVSVGKAR